MSTSPGGSVNSTLVRERASDAFSTLGNETRLSILLALWDAQDFTGHDPAVSFSELRDRVAVGDSGQFNYHLEKLVGEFIRRDESGYTITQAGNRIVQAIIATVGVEEPAPQPLSLSHPCPVCDGVTELVYVDGHVFLRCTECPGLYELGESRPEGVLTSEECTRSAFAGREFLEVFDAVRTRAKSHFQMMVQGVCPQCIGLVARSLEICDSHDSEGQCETCHSRFQARIELECVVCKQFAQGPIRTLMGLHPSVVSLYIDEGVPFSFEPDEVSHRTHRLHPDGELNQEVLSVEPAAVKVTLDYDGGQIAYTVDEELAITDVST